MRTSLVGPSALLAVSFLVGCDPPSDVDVESSAITVTAGTEVVRAKHRVAAIGQDDQRVYWAEHDRIAVAPIGGGPATTLVEGDVVDFEGDGFVVGGDYVYWVTGLNAVLPDNPKAEGLCRVMRVAKSGGPAEIVLDGFSHPGLGEGRDAHSLAADATNLYVTVGGSFGHGVVLKMPLAGGPPIVLATEQGYPDHLAVDSTNVYWASSRDLMKVPNAGGAPQKLMTTDALYGFEGIGLDRTNVYWLTSPKEGLQASLGKVPIEGGTPTTLATGLGDHFNLSPTVLSDGERVYFSSGFSSDADAAGLQAVPVAGGASVVVVPGGAASLAREFSLAGGSLLWGDYHWVGGAVAASIRRSPLPSLP